MTGFPSPFTIAIGENRGWHSVKLPGRNTAVSQTFVPVAPGGVYMTPQPSEAVNLRIRAGGSALDIYAGTGAWQVKLTGLNAEGYEIFETIYTAGFLQSSATTQKFIRLFSAEVVASGTYATQTAGSHAADIVIEDTGGTHWTTIPLNGFPESITRIGAFTIPANFEAYLIGFRINAQAQKLVDAVVFKRSSILEEAAPYAPMTALTELFNISGFIDESFDAPIYLPPRTDIGVMAKIDNQTARVNSDLGLLLRRIK